MFLRIIVNKIKCGSCIS